MFTTESRMDIHALSTRQYFCAFSIYPRAVCNFCETRRDDLRVQKVPGFCAPDLASSSSLIRMEMWSRGVLSFDCGNKSYIVVVVRE